MAYDPPVSIAQDALMLSAALKGHGEELEGDRFMLLDVGFIRMHARIARASAQALEELTRRLQSSQAVRASEKAAEQVIEKARQTAGACSPEIGEGVRDPLSQGNYFKQDERAEAVSSSTVTRPRYTPVGLTRKPFAMARPHADAQDADATERVHAALSATRTLVSGMAQRAFSLQDALGQIDRISLAALHLVTTLRSYR